MNCIIIAMLTKLSLSKADEWYKQVDKVQQFINSSHRRSTGTSPPPPFELLMRRKMRLNDDPELRNLIQQDIQQERHEAFQQERADIRQKTKRNITKI